MTLLAHQFDDDDVLTSIWYISLNHITGSNNQFDTFRISRKLGTLKFAYISTTDSSAGQGLGNMSIVFDHFTWWFQGGGKNQKSKISSEIASESGPDPGLGEMDYVKFPLVDRRMASASRRSKRKWHSREERKIDKEYDVVLVPSDGGCVSGSESDGSDYSIGWLEPHGSGFQSDEDSDDSFAVIVPCYGRSLRDLVDYRKDTFLDGLVNFPDIYAAEGKRYMEQWLSSLQNS